MGFQALLSREDFYGILKETLQEYYRKKYGPCTYVGYEKRPEAKEMIINPRLGVIVSQSASKPICEYLYKSFNIRNNKLKNLAAKLFVFLSIHVPGLFALSRRLYVYPASMINDSVVFYYLNRSIRIFDFCKKRTFSIKKHTFTSKYFDNQLKFRREFKYDFIPPIIGYGDDWFEEYILEGCSLARETDENVFQQGIGTVLTQINSLQRATCTYVDASEYVEKITSKILSLLHKASTCKCINTYNSAIEYLSALTSYLDVRGHKIPIAESHGDLQVGNVWLSPNKTWIIDWETHDLRTVWFDAITIKFGTRYYGGIRNLVVDHMNENTRKQLLGDFCTTLNIRQMVIVFLIEDLLFYLEDMMELPFEGGKESFDAYMNDIISTQIIMCLNEE